MILLRKILYCVVVLLAVGCESMFDMDDTIMPLPEVKPTVPLKRRPIVPTTKLPRPRVVETPQIDTDVLSVDVYSEDVISTLDSEDDFALW